MSEANQVPLLRVQFGIEPVVLVTVQEENLFVATFKGAVPAVERVAGFRSGTAEGFVFAVHISADEMRFDSLEYPHDFRTADVAAVNDD